MTKRILVVDDDADIQTATELILTKAGYEVSNAANAKEAMKKLKSERIDLILLDVMMETETEGFHLAYDIRNDEKLKDIPIIILSCIEEATGLSLDPQKNGDYLPVEAFLRKPLEPDALKAKVAELIS